MPETIDVPGLGKTRAVYVYAGAALVIGIVGYAWWKNSQNQPTDFVGASPDDFGATDYDSPLGSSGGNSTGSFDSTDPEAIDTNAKWTQFAIEKLSNIGWEAQTVSVALGKYLARKGLTETEITIVNAAIAIAGPPPVGGPYPINSALPETPGTGTGDTKLYHPVVEGNHLEPWLATVNAKHPGLNLTRDKLVELNPGLSILQADDQGYLSSSNPPTGTVRWVINSHTNRDLRIK